MRYFVSLADHLVQISFDSTGDLETRAHVLRSGSSASPQSHLVELTRISSWHHVALRIDNSVHDVFFDPKSRRITIDGVAHDATIEDERERAAHQAAAAVSKGPVIVKSSMPGIVRAVLVKPGDAVAAKQPLVILEAMKMENELRAEHGGVVREIKVAAGTPVEKDAVLVVIDPPQAGS